MCAWAARAVRQSQGTAVTCRLPVTRGCCPAELRDSPAALHVISSLALLLQVKDQVPFQSLVLQALLDIITIMWLIKLSQIYANIGPWPRPFVYVFDQPQFLIWQHIKTYRWIKIDHNFPIKYDSLQIVTQPVTAAIHRAWIIHVQAGSAVRAQPSRTVFTKITPQPHPTCWSKGVPVDVVGRLLSFSQAVLASYRTEPEKAASVREMLPTSSWALHTQSCLTFKY